MESRASTPFNPAEAAREAAYAVGPQVYQLTGIPEGPVRFFVIGCHGNGGEAQQKTAALMNKVADDMEKAGDTMPVCMIFAGDNLYDDGVSDPSADAFNTCFDNIYYVKDYSALKKFAGLLCLGNHDVYMHAKAIPKLYAQGDNVGINQVAHTYIGQTEQDISNQVDFFLQKELELAKLPRWGMPYFFYSVIAGNTQVFMLDSNSYLKHFLEMHNPEKTANGRYIETGHVNQAAWLEKEFHAAKAAGRQVLFVQHHPWQISGKRSFQKKFDTLHYLYQTEIDQLNELLLRLNPNYISTQSYNEFFPAVFQQQKVHPDLLFAAHEHFISYLNTVERPVVGQPPLRQVTSGGGGGERHARASYRDHPYVGLHQQNNGFVMVTCDPKDTNKFVLDFYTREMYLKDHVTQREDVFLLEGLHLRFDESSHLPLTQPHHDLQVSRLCTVVLAACNLYFNYLKDDELNVVKPSAAPPSGYLAWALSSVVYGVQNLKDHLSHDKKHERENSLVHTIQAFIQQWELPEYETVLERLNALTAQLPYRNVQNARGFHSILKDMIALEFKSDLQQLLDDELRFRDSARLVLL